MRSYLVLGVAPIRKVKAALQGVSRYAVEGIASPE
jgi:hypothetical protein